MFQLSRQTGFAEEARHGSGVPGILRQQLFNGHISTQLVIPGQPNPANSAAGVETRKDVTPVGAGLIKL
jgi:hypothetical protein